MKTKQKPAPKRNSSNSMAKRNTLRAEPNLGSNSDKLQVREERFQNIFDTVPVSIWEEDFSEVKKALNDLRSQGVTDFRRYLMEHPEFVSDAMQKLIVIDVNEMTIKLYEAKDKVELLGSKNTTFGPQMLDSFTDELIALADGKSYFEGEVIDQTLHGRRLHLWRTIVFPKAESKFRSVLVCLTDITERKQVEKALRESESRLLTVLEATPIPITLTSLEDGIVLYGNSALADLLGVSLSEMIGQRVVDFYAEPTDRSKVLAELERLGSLHDYEVCLRRRGGTFVWVSLSTEKTILDGQVCLLNSFYDITERKRAEALQAAIYEISEAANKAESLNEIFQSVHTIIGQVMPAQNFYIALYDAEQDLISFPYYVDEVEGSASIPATRPGRGMTEYVIRMGKPLLSDLSNFEELAREGEVELVGPPSPIWIGAPLIVDGRTIGAIALQDYHNANVYTERELRMLEFVSGQVAKAIERTRLIEDVQRNNRILSALQEATVPLIRQTELSEVLQEILKQATGLFETTDGYIYFVKPDESEIVLSMGIGPSSQYIGSRLRIGEGLAGKVWQTGQRLTVDDYDSWSGRSKIFEDTRLYATAAVPLTSKSKMIGVLGIGYIVPDRKFDHEGLELLTRFAELASIAIENARLYTLSQQELAERKMAEEALRQAEAKYRTLVERLPVVVYTAELGTTGNWHYVSPQIGSLLGFTPEEWMANPALWYEQVHPEDRDRQVALEEQAYERGESFDAEYRIMTRNGREVWMRDTAQILPSPEGKPPIVQGVLVDITERKQAEFLQASIYRISDAANSSGNMDELYVAIHQSLQSIMTADNFFIALYDKRTDLLSFPYYVDQHDPKPLTTPLGRGLSAYVIRRGIPLLGRPDEIQKLEDSGEVESVGTRSIDWLGVPLKIQNETIGVMAVQTYTEGIRYIQRDLDILGFVSGQVALSIERKQAEEKIRRQVERLKALRTIDMFIAGGTDLHLTLQTILNQAVSQLGVDAASILLLNNSLHTLEYAEGIGFRTKGIEQTSMRIGEGFAGKVALQREAIIIRDISASNDLFSRQALHAGEGFTCYFGVPLIAKGEMKGVLEVFHRSQIDADSEWTDFLESLAGQAALAIDNASLFDSLQRSNLELGMAYETTLEGWSAALDLRDKETEGHTRRVTDLTLKLAQAMGLSEKERVHMRRGALLHDIGKMGIPDRILLKPDQLTSDEWEIMHQHPIYAYNLLSPITHLRPALDIPYCHHEKWDGTGYPRGLKSEAIPLSARIFAVADVWDALCSDRPYRPAWTRQKALEHIKSLSGIHFDPKVVDVFLQMVDH